MASGTQTAYTISDRSKTDGLTLLIREQI